MSFSSELASQVVAAAGANAEEAAAALGRALDGEFALQAAPHAGAPADGVSGPGLALLLRFPEGAIAGLLPAASGLVPGWCAAPDATGESKLATLAQELSMLLLPDDLMADAFELRWSDDLAAAARRAAPGPDARAVRIELARGEDLGELRLVWPLASAEELFAGPAAPNETEAAPPGVAAVDGPDKAARSARVLRWEPPAARDFRDLPPNARNLLRVEVAISAELASKRMPIGDIVGLGPGSIITFEKSCDDPVTLCVGGHAVAQAEAVKVGEKFGVRVREMILPEEHFRPMLPARLRG